MVNMIRNICAMRILQIFERDNFILHGMIVARVTLSIMGNELRPETDYSNPPNQFQSFTCITLVTLVTLAVLPEKEKQLDPSQ